MPLRPTPPALTFEYPAHLRAQAEAAPRAPGVYFFYAQGDSMPLYIGKSVDIRSRLLAHLRTPEEARMLRQAQRIEYQQTAGEIGALLLESRLIKELQPLKNKRLRRQRRLCSLRMHQGKLEIIDTTALAEGPQLYGLFRSRRMAIEALMLLADEHRLCHSLLGIEPANTKGCFRAQIRKCAGACRGDETHAAHTERLLQALAHWAVHRWPYPRPLRCTNAMARWSNTTSWTTGGTSGLMPRRPKPDWRRPSRRSPSMLTATKFLSVRCCSRAPVWWCCRRWRLAEPVRQEPFS